MSDQYSLCYAARKKPNACDCGICPYKKLCWAHKPKQATQDTQYDPRYEQETQEG